MEGKNIVLKDGRRLNRNHPQGFQSNGVIHVVDTVVLPNWRRTWLGAPEGAPSFAKANTLLKPDVIEGRKAG